MDVRVLIISFVSFFLFTSKKSYSDDIIFDSSAIENTNQITARNIDISKFSHSSHPAGKYYVTIVVNKKSITRSNINFVEDTQGKLVPELSIADFHKFGIYFSDKQIDEKVTNKIPGALEGISTRLNFKKLELDINIPQAYLRNGPDEDLNVPSAQWDEGINALSLNYDLNGNQNKAHGESFHPGNQYMRLNGGLNIDAWRLRSISTFDSQTDGEKIWNTEKVWAQRDIPSLRSLLTVGDGNSDAALFDSIDYTGISLATEASMYSDKAQGYAPVIHGIARTSNAQVIISQNGNVIYKRYVPAGQFVINDLYPQTGGGELKITINEADGSEHHFTQAWGMVSAMQRQGFLRYNINIGRTNNNNEDFSQLNFFYGLPDEMTIFAGSFLTPDYRAVDLGYAFGFGQFGSISADITSMAINNMSNECNTQGQSYRLQYSKNISDSDTDIAILWAFSPTADYISYPDTIAYSDITSDDEQPAYQKNKLQVSMNQPLGGNNMLVISAWRAEYWYGDTEESLSLSDNLSLDKVSLSFDWAWTQNENNNSEQQFMANIQIPFSVFQKDVWLSLTGNLQRPGSPSQSVGINGNALDDDSLSWSIGTTHGNSEATDQNASIDYKGKYGEYITNYSHTTQHQNLSYEIKGSLIASTYGITAGQPFNSTDAVALIKATGAPHLAIENNAGVETDPRGYAIVPYLQPYRQDSVTLNRNKDTNDTVELGNTSISVVPTDGAIILASFAPHIGKKLFLTLLLPDGTSLPFGATATINNSNNEGIINEKGQVYLSGAPAEGVVTAQWGKPTQTCHATYSIPSNKREHLYEMQLTCK